MGGVDIGCQRAVTPPWPGLVIDFCTSPVRTGNCTYRGTPHVKDMRSDDFPETLTDCVRPRRNDSSHDRGVGRLGSGPRLVADRTDVVFTHPHKIMPVIPVSRFVNKEFLLVVT